MNFLELAKQRYSVRSYQNREVEHEKLIQILEAGQIAPSAVNKQPWHFYVYNTEESLQKIRPVYYREWFKEAPLVIVICGKHNEAWHRKADSKDHTDVDISIAVDHMTLAATSIGLGSCWICNFEPKLCREAMDLAEGEEPIAILSIGYPADQAPEKKRKSIEEITTFVK